MFSQKVAVITGGASGIGKAVADGFRKEGAHVCIIDKTPNDYFTGDISQEDNLKEFAYKVIKEYGKIDFIVNNAMLSKGGLLDCSFDDFNYVLRTGITGPFMLAKLFKEHLAEGASIVNISSSRDRMSQYNTESYTAAKGGISALTHAMAITLAGKARVNSISPGWIDTIETDCSLEDKKQQPVGRVGKPEDIVSLVIFLCSDKAGFITGENIVVDGGMTRLMIYNGEHGWSYKTE